MHGRGKIYRIATACLLGWTGCSGPAHQISPQPSKPGAAPYSNHQSVREPGQAKINSVRPLDQITACRPASARKKLSVTRYLHLDDPRQDVVQQQFQVPKVFPGAEAPNLTLPKPDPNASEEQQQAQVRKIYKQLPALPPVPFSPDQATESISLAELEQLAYQHHPALKAAMARMEQARGRVLQVGLYPNPMAGYQADTVGTSATAGYNGVFASQTVVTADKLKLKQSVEWQEVIKAEFALRQIEIEVASQVRRNYIRALIAQERLTFARELARLFEKTYKAQIDLVVGGESAAYEPLQLRVFAVEAQNAAIKAGNEYVSAWRQMATVLNQPVFSPRVLEGSVEMPIPEISYETALELMLSRHTDLAMARAGITQSEINLCLQHAVPVPNVDLAGVIQHDDTTNLNDVSFNLQVGVSLPVFNKNQGNIYGAQSKIVESHQQLQWASNQLAAKLAEVHARYQTNRALMQNYKDQILPDQVRTYRGVHRRFREGADSVDFAQIIVTQQQLGQSINQYLNVLEAQWLAVVDLAEVIQADNLFHLNVGAETPPAPAVLETETLPLVPAPIVDPAGKP